VQHALRQTFVFTETYVMLQPEVKIPSENTRQDLKKLLEAFVVWIGRLKS
jgi:hypothetical protein